MTSQQLSEWKRWQQLRASELDRIYSTVSFHRSFQEPQATLQCSCIINGSMSVTIWPTSLASQNYDNQDFHKCTHSSLHRTIPLSCCCSVTRGGCGLASCGLAWGQTKRSSVLIWMGISSKRSFKISLFLPLLILLYNLDIICAKKVLLTCNNCIAAGCGPLNPAKKRKRKKNDLRPICSWKCW